MPSTPFDFTKLIYYVVGGVLNLLLWLTIVVSFEELGSHADAVGATLAVLFGALAGGQFYKSRQARKDRKGGH